MNQLITIFFILLAIIAFFLLIRSSANTKVGNNEQKLVKRCYGDTEQAERLINLEKRRNPRLSRDMAAKAAVESLLRDNR